jgi:cyclopropane-fatty-acyl-phospholipid synthase
MDPISRYLHDTTTLPAAEQRLLQVFQHLECGRLRLALPSGQTIVLTGALPGPEADLTVLHPDGVTRLVMRGLNHLAQGYITGIWHSRDLTRLLYLFCCNPLLFPPPPAPPPAWRALMTRLLDSLRLQNGPQQPAAADHTSLLPAADFFTPWLGEELDDGPGLFQAEHTTPALAQAAARRSLIEALGPVTATHRLLEIGGSWGCLSVALAGLGACLTVQTRHEITARHCHARLSALPSQPARCKTGRGEMGQSESGHGRTRKNVTVKHGTLTQIRGRFDRIVWTARLTEPLPQQWTPQYCTGVFRSLKEKLTQGGRLVVQMPVATSAAVPGLLAVLFPETSPQGAPPSEAALTTAIASAWLRPVASVRFREDCSRLYGTWRETLADTLHVDTPTDIQQETRRWLYHLSALEAGHLAGVVLTLQHRLEHARQENRG